MKKIMLLVAHGRRQMLAQWHMLVKILDPLG